MFRFVLDQERQVTQTRVGQDAELLRLASNAVLLRLVSEVSMLLGTRGPHFSLECDLSVEVRHRVSQTRV